MLASPIRIAALVALFVVALLSPRAAGVFRTGDGNDSVEKAEKATAKTWFCPPCGDEHDRVPYDKPGRCPICGMALLERAEIEKAKAEKARARGDEDHAVAQILVFPGVEIIDFTGPFEILGAAGFAVQTVAKSTAPLTTSMGLKITPDVSLANAPVAKVVVVPGGNVLATQQDPEVLGWLRERAEKADVVLSVCNGAFILARSGLLDGKSATTFAPLIEGLRAVAPKTNVVSDKRWVDNGRIVTSAGLSSGIDGALHVVEKLHGKGAAQKVAVNLEYNWDREGRWVRAQLADRLLSPLYRAANDWDREILSHEGTTEAWESRWRLRTIDSPDAVLGSVASALAVASDHGRFALKDEKGNAWSGLATATPDGKGTILLTVKIARARAS